MKVKTNLSPTELRKVGVGLQKLADKQQQSEIVLENAAERDLIARGEAVFDFALASLLREVDSVLLEKEEG